MQRAGNIGPTSRSAALAPAGADFRTCRIAERFASCLLGANPGGRAACLHDVYRQPRGKRTTGSSLSCGAFRSGTASGMAKHPRRLRNGSHVWGGSAQGVRQYLGEAANRQLAFASRKIPGPTLMTPPAAKPFCVWRHCKTSIDWMFNTALVAVCLAGRNKRLFAYGVVMRSAAGVEENAFLNPEFVQTQGSCVRDFPMNCGQTSGGRESGRPCRTSGQTAFCRVFSAPRGSDGNAAIEIGYFQSHNALELIS